jgi:hypothetical protein
MPKTFIKKSTSWVEIKSIFVKKSTGWTEAKNVFIKKTTGWVKVFTKASLPDTTTAPSIRTTNTGAGTIYDGPVADSPQFLDTDLFGKDGEYTNFTSKFGRKFTRGDSASTLTRTLIVNDDRFTSTGGVTTAQRLACDDQYLFFELTVQNGSSANEIYPISSAIKMIKKQPRLGAFTTSLTGNSTPGSVLTLNYNLENYYYNRVEQANSRIRWWRSTTTSPGGVMVKEEILTNTVTSSDSTSLSGTSTYTIAASADDDSYIVVEIVAGSSWTRHNSYNNEYRINSYSAGPVKAPYRFSFGKTLYVSSNGHIGLDAGTSSATSMSDGRNISIFPKDLVQYYLAEYSDSSTYSLYIRSYLYNTSASALNALDYQIKFYNNPNIDYCDVYIVRKGSNVSATSDFAPGYYAYRETGSPGIVGPYTISAGSRIRIYFGGTAATTSGPAWTLINDSVWDVIQTWTYPPGADDIFTPVVTAANQQAPVLTAPTLNSVTVGPQGGSVSANFTGGSGPFYQMFWWSSSSPPTGQTSPDATGFSSPLTDTTGPATTTTNYMYVRSVATANELSVGPSTVASSWSNGISFNMTSTEVSQNSVPTVRATNTFSTSIVKYLDSITWSSGTYTNAASITSVLLYSTVSGNLVAGPTGNTLSSFRTANPYVLTTTDPAGTPYIFAVRDTVVGTNGTTYYFYSGQITSANADAVAFSYGGSTSAAGGWTASVNSGTQAGASYSFVSATAGSGTVNASTGAITASGLGSNAPSTITVNKNVPGYNTAQASTAGTSATVANFTLTYNGNNNTGGSTAVTEGNGSVVLRANGFTRTNCTFQGWSTSSTGGVTNAAGTSFNLTANTTLWAVWAANANSATAPPGFVFAGNNRPTTGRKQWTWTGTGTVTGGVRTGFRVQISSTSSTSGFSIASGSPLATSARSYDIAVSPVTSPRWLRIASEYTDGLGVTRVGDFTSGV